MTPTLRCQGRCVVVAVCTFAVGLVIIGGTSSAAAQVNVETASVEGDVMRGWRLFHAKGCAGCHGIWDEGAHVGPDLGRTRSGRLPIGQLAGVMWNHIPKMLGQMQATRHPPSTISAKEMIDLFALIYFMRQLGEEGSPTRGEQILRSKGCGECHSVDMTTDGFAPDLAKWGKYPNPVAWAQMMWEHAPLMEEAMLRSDMTWPKLEGSDLVHIVAYIRSVGVSGEKQYLQPGSTSKGRHLFVDKKCDTCHPTSGPDLSKITLPVSVGALASRMWNHSPEMTRVMRKQDVERRPISAQELAHILAYILAVGERGARGNAERGIQVFSDKGCAQCHDPTEMQEGAGPVVAELGRRASPAGMAASMWNHGQTMLEKMTEAGLSWPIFEDTEMVDLMAYLQTAYTASERQELGGP